MSRTNNPVGNNSTGQPGWSFAVSSVWWHPFGLPEPRRAINLHDYVDPG